MVRQVPRRVPPFTAPALAIAALGFVVAGVLLGTTGLPGAEPRSSAPVLTRPAAQVVVPGRPVSIVIESAGDGPASAPAAGGGDGAAPPPASALGPQSAPTSGPPDGASDSGGGGETAGLVEAIVALVPPVTLPVETEPLVDVGPLAESIDDAVGDAVDDAVGGLL